MNWTVEHQTHFDALRARELAGTLTTTERLPLNKIVAQLEAAEARYLAPSMAQIQTQQIASRIQGVVSNRK